MELTRLLTRAKVLLLQGAHEGAESFIEQAMAEAGKIKSELAELYTLRTRVTEMAAEVERLQSVIDDANAQEPVAYGIPNSAITGKRQPMMTLHHERCGQYPELMVPLYAHPIPSQQSPAVAVPESVTNAQMHGSKYPEWQCFHCGEVFNTVGGAAQHFGADPTKKPGCMLKVEIGKERGLLWEYRELETKYDLLRSQVANGTTEIENSVQEMITNNRIALCKAEEDGYNKGLRDGMIQSPRITEQDAQKVIADFIDWQLVSPYMGGANVQINLWIKESGRTLLNKLNGDHNGK